MAQNNFYSNSTFQFKNAKVKTKKNTVTVNVLKQDYKLATEGSPERALKIAKYLNDAVNDIQKKSPNIQGFNALVLAALNITEKYFTLDEKNTRIKREMQSKVVNIVRYLKEATKE